MELGSLSLNSVKLGILRVLASVGHQHKFNLLGRGSEQGDLERQLGVRFNPAQRHQAALAFTELESGGFIQPTYQDLISPDLWVAITEKGRSALAKGVVDSDGQQIMSPREIEQKFKILFSSGQAVADFASWTNAGADSVSAVVVLFIDIDKFKSLNTQLGETVVDETLLPDFQRFLEAASRHRGYAYRHGGEEFVIALPNHTRSEGIAFAERLRAETEAKLFKVRTRQVRITISVGLASWPENGSTYVNVVEAANMAEHQAKKDGRNRVVVAEAGSA